MNRGEGAADLSLRRANGWSVVAAMLAALFLAVPAANANWLTKLAREAGEAGGRAGRHAAGSLDHAAAHVAALPKTVGSTGAKGVALAAHATPEGHWTFVNAAGERMTAGTPAEMLRIRTLLAGDADAAAPLSLYLSEDTIFLRRNELAQLPKDARLHVVSGAGAHPLHRIGSGDAALAAEIRPGLLAALDEAPRFRETVWQLSRPLNRADVRVLSLKPGSADALPRVPRFDPATKHALVDEIEPSSLVRAFPALRGQTAVVTGRTTPDGRLVFQPASGGEQHLVLADLRAAAAASDVNLVVLQSAAPRQPGGRNWLWQTVAVEGMSDALKKATFGDFLASLAGTRGTLLVRSQDVAGGRVALRAEPLEAGAPLGGRISDWLTEVAGNLTGNVVTAAIEADQRSAERQKELDARIVPGIPSLVQIWFIASVILGVMGLAYARAWWQRLWPRERLQEYAGRIGYAAARSVRGLAFLLVFLPLVGPFAFVAQMAETAWQTLTAPLRFYRWLRRKPGTAG